MSRKSNIRWTENDDKEIAKAVRNFNAKIRRVEKKYPELKMALPEKLTAKEMREIIHTRNDLKRELNALKRFTSRDNKIKKFDDGSYEGIVELPDTDNNIKITKWQRNEVNRRAAIINKRRERRRQQVADLDASSRGKKLGYKKGALGMGKLEDQSLSPFKPSTEKMTQTGARKKLKSAMKESSEAFWTEKDKRLKENYLKALTVNLTNEERAAIEKAIENMSFDEFYKIFMAEDKAFMHDLYMMDESQRSYYVGALMEVRVGEDHESTKPAMFLSPDHTIYNFKYDPKIEELNSEEKKLLARRDELKPFSKWVAYRDDYSRLNKDIRNLRARRKRLETKKRRKK